MRGVLSIGFGAIFSSAVLLGCGPNVGGGEGGSSSLRETADAAEADGLNVYWLGENFSAGQTVFDQVDTSSSNDATGTTDIELHYTSSAYPGSLDVRSYKLGSWDGSVSTNPAQFADTRTEVVIVNGRSATLFTWWLRAGQSPSGHRLLIDRPDAIVVVQTSSYRGDQNEEVNPLMDKGRFLRQAAQVREYPD